MNSHIGSFIHGGKRRRPRTRHVPAVQGALAVITRRNRYLICQRRVGDFLGGCWEFPGGKRHPGESWEACLRREVREELGVAIRALRPFGILRHRYRDRAIMLKVFRCLIARGHPKPLDSHRLRWVGADQLKFYAFPPANQPLLTRLSRQGRRTPAPL